MVVSLCAALGAAAESATAVPPEPSGAVRIATYSAEFSRAGPGLLLRDILKRDEQVEAAISAIKAVTPDVLLLTEFDRDPDLMALTALADALRDSGLDYPHLFAPASNAGRDPLRDRDGDGRIGGDRDGQGYGQFRGDGAMALLSRWPIVRDDVRDFTDLLWADLPAPRRPEVKGQPFPDANIWADQRLSSTGHWVVPLRHPDGTLTLLAFAATPPVFDGPEDRNGKRNADEISLWQHVLDGYFGVPPVQRFVVLGRANLDPVDGDGLHGAISALLADHRLQDPAPRGPPRSQQPGQMGDPALDTADWPLDIAGALRVDYVLPSRDWHVAGSGVFWPDPGQHPSLSSAGPHKLVWVDLLPP